jgi:hypothetical protein
LTSQRHQHLESYRFFRVAQTKRFGICGARATVGASVKAGATGPQAAICGGVSPANQSESAESINAPCRCAARAATRRPDNKKGAAEVAPFTVF